MHNIVIVRNQFFFVNNFDNPEPMSTKFYTVTGIQMRPGMVILGLGFGLKAKCLDLGLDLALGLSSLGLVLVALALNALALA